MPYESRFIVPYMEWFLNSTDAPHTFGEASALMCLSTVALRHRWLVGADTANANLYMMVVGPSSKARKSTTVKRAREMVERVWPSRVGPSDYTMEGLFKWMNEKDPDTNEDHTALTLFASEFTADLARSAGYKNSFRDDLTNVYDGHNIIKIRSGIGKSIEVQSPRVSVMAAIAYDGFARNVTKNDWSSGFLMRFLYLAPTEYRDMLIRPAQEDTYRIGIATEALKSIGNELWAGARGLRLTEEAWKMYETALRKHIEHADAAFTGDPVMDDEPLTTTYLHRFWPNIQKLALLYQLDIDPMTNVTAEAMQRALDFAAHCWRSFMIAHRKTTANDFGTLCQMVLEKIDESGTVGLSMSAMGEIFNFSQQLVPVVNLLKSTDKVAEQLIRGRRFLFRIR